MEPEENKYNEDFNDDFFSPDDRVWGEIEKSLPEEKRKRSFFYPLLFLGAIALVTSTFLLSKAFFQSKYSSKETIELVNSSSSVAENKVNIDNQDNNSIQENNENSENSNVISNNEVSSLSKTEENSQSESDVAKSEFISKEDRNREIEFNTTVNVHSTKESTSNFQLNIPMYVDTISNQNEINNKEESQVNSTVEGQIDEKTHMNSLSNSLDLLSTKTLSIPPINMLSEFETQSDKYQDEILTTSIQSVNKPIHYGIALNASKEFYISQPSVDSEIPLNELLQVSNMQNQFFTQLQFFYEIQNHGFAIGLEYARYVYKMHYDIHLPYDLSSEEDHGEIHTNHLTHSLPNALTTLETDLILQRSESSPVIHNEDIYLTLDAFIQYQIVKLDFRYYYSLPIGLSFGAGAQPGKIFLIHTDNQLASHHTYVTKREFNANVVLNREYLVDLVAFVNYDKQITPNSSIGIGVQVRKDVLNPNYPLRIAPGVQLKYFIR